MTMIYPRFSFIFALAILSAFADATTEESLTMKIFDPNFPALDQKIQAQLRNIDLERYGYKKEVITKLVSGPGRDKPRYEKMVLYYKIVDCSRLQEINQELQTLLPAGLLERDLVNKSNTEFKARNLTSMKQCKVGLEVHFKKAEGDSDQKNKTRHRRDKGKKKEKGHVCGICIHIEATS